MKPTLDIDLLRAFTVVAVTGVISQAAVRLGRTQAAISMQMKRLEDAAGHTLLRRTGKGVVLTGHGEVLLRHARKILGQHDEALEELSGEALAGTLTFGCPEDYAVRFLPPLLRSFAAIHPKILVNVTCAPTPRLVERMDRGALDLALISVRSSTVASEQVLRREPLVWVANRTDDAVSENPLRLALSDLDTLDHLAAVDCLARERRPFTICYSSSSLSGLTAVVRSGPAVSVLTECAVPVDLVSGRALGNLPKLPELDIVLKSASGGSDLSRAFEQHITTLLPAL